MSDPNDPASNDPTRRFFNEMSTTYDDDLEVLGWDPVRVVQEWPFMVYPGEVYLDVGCGTGALLTYFQGAQRKVYGMDLSENMLERARQRDALRYVEFEQGSAGKPWPFQSNMFDKVSVLAMLEFVEELDVAMDELLRVLRPGGRAILSVEDRIDWEGNDRGAKEQRYGKFPLWRRSLEEVDLHLPPSARIIRTERLRGYEVLELGFTTAYHVLEIEKDAS